MSEVNKRICKVCKELKLRILDGKYPDQKNKRWLDETGKPWNGRTCNPCDLNRLKNHMRTKRLSKIESTSNE